MTTPHERDRSLEQWLSASLPDSGAAADDCLDPETAAAWLDGGLDMPARQLAEAHVSTCARCQALVGAVVRLETAGTTEAAPLASPWRTWLNWMVPLGALATAGLALVVWLSLPTRQTDGPLQTRVERPPAPSPARQATNPPAEQQAAAAAEPARRPDTPPNLARNPASANAPVPDLAAGAPASATPVPADAAAERMASAANAGAADPAAAGPQAAPVPPPAALRARAAAPATTETAAAASAQQDAVSNQIVAAKAAAAIEVISPDPQVRWRLAGRDVAWSTDRGATWTPVVAAAGRLVAGSAPSPAVCWLVGEQGLVLRTVDGVTFVRVTAPVAADLSTVVAGSAASAVVGTADGRRFITSDGGAAWAPAR